MTFVLTKLQYKTNDDDTKHIIQKKLGTVYLLIAYLLYILILHKK